METKKISHTEIQTFLDCQKKWHLRYKLGYRLTTIHTQFGSMAHNVLESKEIPMEELYGELKEYFKITSWSKYFTSIFEALREEMQEWDLLEQEVFVEQDYLRGKIDAVWQNKETGRYLLTDYKFSTSNKDDIDLLIDQQLYVYGVLYALSHNIPIENISTGFITIPKTQLDEPRILVNGKLSKDKAQNVTEKSYRDTIARLGLDESDYSDVLDALSGRKLVKLVIGSISPTMLQDIFENIEHVFNEMQKGYYLEKASSFDCRRCDLFDVCKIRRVK